MRDELTAHISSEGKKTRDHTNQQITLLTQGFTASLSETNSQVNFLTKCNSATSGRLHELSRRVNRTEALLNGSIKISGLPSSLTQSLSASNVAIRILHFLSMQVVAREIKSARYGPEYQTSFPSSSAQSNQQITCRSLFIDFFNPSLAQEAVFLKKGRGKVLLREIFTDIQSNLQIYINYALPKYLSDLLNAVKKWNASHNFKFIWHHEGRILLKKSENSETHQFISLEEFQIFTRDFPLGNQRDTVPVTARMLPVHRTEDAFPGGPLIRPSVFPQNSIPHSVGNITQISSSEDDLTVDQSYRMEIAEIQSESNPTEAQTGLTAGLPGAGPGSSRDAGSDGPAPGLQNDSTGFNYTHISGTAKL